MRMRRIKEGLIRRWERYWMVLAGVPFLWRFGCWGAGLFRRGYKSQTPLARISEAPFAAWSAKLAHRNLRLGKSVYIGEDVVFYGADSGGDISIGDRSCIHAGVIVETAENGLFRVGSNTHIQARCQFAAVKGSIHIGSEVQIAPACGFYPYSHGMALGSPMREQPITSKGDIVIEDDVWFGYGAIVLEDVRVGQGAVVAAGAVVRDDVPPYAIVAGVPARVVGQRGEAA